jgi:hypothetical protein
VEVAHEFVVFVNGKVLAQHPIRDGLHKFGGLFTVKTSDNGWRHQLLEVSDEHAFRGFTANLDFVQAKTELLAKLLGVSLESACIFLKGGSALRFRGLTCWDINRKGAFFTASIGFAPLDHLSCTMAVFSSSCVYFCSFLIV